MAAESGFAERLAYVRWLRSRGRLAAETDRELAADLGVGEQWLRKWKGRADAPEGRREAEAIGRALAPMGVSVKWLYDGEGPPPEPKLWDIWLAELTVHEMPESGYEPVDLGGEDPGGRRRGGGAG